MRYETMLKRTWTLIWAHKHLMVLGVLSALGGGGAATPGANYQVSDSDVSGATDMPMDMTQFDLWTGLAASTALLIVGLLLAIGLVIWAITMAARGGLIAGVDRIERGQDSSFSLAWSAGWQRIWTLIGIGLLPLLPVLALGLLALMAGGALYGFNTVQAGPNAGGMGGAVVALIGAIACIAIPVALALGLLSTFANRACMLEQTGVWDSYRRGWAVLRANFGAALILFLLQIAISLALGIALFVPGLIASLCCLFWPLLLLVQGAITAYFSTVWTLAWREWTGTSLTPAMDATV